MTTPFRLATFNLRYNTASDGANAWPYRRAWVRDLMAFHGFDIVGVQEALAPMLEFLTDGTGYASVGVGRDDGGKSGEFAPILYRPSRFTPEASGTFWLSETPETPSRGWDADLKRICTWARFQDTANGTRFTVFNTHFDHNGVRAQENAAKLIGKKWVELAGPDMLVFVTGDLNSGPESKAVQTLRSVLRDTREVSLTPPYGPWGTFQGFNTGAALDRETARDSRIDYIFVGGPVTIHRYGVLTDGWTGRYPSDHLPIVVEATL